MNNNKLQILNLALLLTVGGAASGEELAFLGTSNAVVRDFTGSGVFTQFQVPSGGFGLSIRKFDFEVPSEIPRDERSLVSFNVLALNNADVLRAYLDFRITGYTSSSQRVGILGYNSNGVLSIADAARSARLLASYQPAELGLGRHSLELDSAAINLLTTPSTQFIGLRFQAVGSPVNTQIAHITSGFNDPPTLRFILVPEPDTCAMFVFLGCAIVGGIGGGRRRLCNAQMNP